MAPKLPGKFDDISKTASSVLGDDFQTSGYQFSAKQKTALDGAVSTTTVDLWGKDTIKAIGKMSWKFPKVLGKPGFSIDKLELDKAGKCKVECSMNKDLHTIDKLSITTATEHDKVGATKLGLTYTGVQDMQFKVEAKPMDFKVDDITGETLAKFGPAVVGLKFQGLKVPAFGASFTHGDIFTSILAKEQFSEFTTHGFYNVSDNLKMGCSYQLGGKKNGTFCLGIDTSAVKGVTLKAKIEANASDPSAATLSASTKKEIVKGMTVIAGGSYALNGKSQSVGMKLSIE